MTADEFLQEYKSNEHIKARTSGSTGTPKEITLPKSMLRLSARRTNAVFGIGAGSRIHSCVAYDFIGGKMTLVRALEAGCTLTAEQPSNRPTLRGDIILNSGESIESDPRECPISLLSIVASQLPYLIEHRKQLPHVERYLIGGGIIPERIRRMATDSGIEAWESYGMTETASHIAIRRVSSENNPPFRVLDGIGISLDQRGCLVIDIPVDSDSRARITTNDLASIENEREFRIHGRIDDVIISGGKKFNPSQAESLLSKEVATPIMFIGEADDKWGEAIILLVEESSMHEKGETIDYIREKAEKILAPWQRPKEIRTINRLPRTSNGKLIRRKR